MSHTRIHPLDLFNHKTTDACIVDVRTPAEVQAESLPHCLHIPLHELTPERLQNEMANSGKDGSRVYLLCQSGKRAEMAVQQLSGNIAAELCIIDGGMNAVKQSNIAIQKTGNAMSLERQVRIVAGGLVLVGAILGATVNAYFYIMSGFVGAGLMFAGITDTCMMGMLIARMPWNK